VLPSRGSLLVSTDLHGNGEDFRALRDLFIAQVERDPATRWALLGDLVHAPDARARAEQPALYGYPDESWAIVDGVLELRRRCPGRVLLVLGNHDHGHVGGAHTRKFYADEVEHLEAQLDASQLAALRGLFEEALLAVSAPCGLLLAHGSPGVELADLAELDRLALDESLNDAAGSALLRTLLTSYGQSDEVSLRVLRAVSAASGLDLGLVVHGHDRDEEGWFVEGEHQICPVLFGAPRENKRYLRFDLSKRYRGVDDVRPEIELRRVHAPGIDLRV
jgi:hypothetical protein